MSSQIKINPVNRLQQVREQEKKLARDMSKQFRQTKQTQNNQDRAQQLRALYEQKQKEIQELQQRKLLQAEALGQAQLLAQQEAEKQAQEQEMRAKWLEQQKKQAELRGRQALEKERREIELRKHEENVQKIRQKQISAEEGIWSVQKAQEYMKIKQKRDYEEYLIQQAQIIPEGGLVINSGQIDYTKTCFHNPVIVRNQATEISALEKARIEEQNTLLRLQQEGQRFNELEQNANERGKKAIEFESIEQQRQRLMEELDKLQKADGINKLLQGVKQQNVHNSQAVKQKQKYEEKQQKLENIFEQEFLTGKSPIVEQVSRPVAKWEAKVKSAKPKKVHQIPQIKDESIKTEKPSVKIQKPQIKPEKSLIKQEKPLTQPEKPSAKQIKPLTQPEKSQIDKTIKPIQKAQQPKIQQIKETIKPVQRKAPIIKKEVQPKSDSEYSDVSDISDQSDYSQEIPSSKYQVYEAPTGSWQTYKPQYDPKQYSNQTEEESSEFSEAQQEINTISEYTEEESSKDFQSPKQVKFEEEESEFSEPQSDNDFEELRKKYEMVKKDFDRLQNDFKRENPFAINEENLQARIAQSQNFYQPSSTSSPQNTGDQLTSPESIQKRQYYNSYDQGDDLEYTSMSSPDHQDFSSPRYSDLLTSPQQKPPLTNTQNLSKYNESIQFDKSIFDSKFSSDLVYSPDGSQANGPLSQPQWPVYTPPSQMPNSLTTPAFGNTQESTRQQLQIPAIYEEEKESLDGPPSLNSLQAESPYQRADEILRGSILSISSLESPQNDYKSLGKYVQQTTPAFEVYNQFKSDFTIPKEHKNNIDEYLEPSQDYYLNQPITEEYSSSGLSSNYMERTNSKSNGELIEIVMGDTKPGSLSEAFKNRKKNLVDKIENRDKAEQPKKREKTQQELNEIRKNMRKPKQIEYKQDVIDIFDDQEVKTAGNLDLMTRLAQGEKVKVNKREMKQLTQKNYNQLPEVRRRREEEAKKEDLKRRLEKAKEYGKIRKLKSAQK